MSFSCRARRDGELLVVTIYGVLNANAQARMRQLLAEEVDLADCRAVVVDMRAGVFTLATVDEWVEAAKDPTPTISHPMALVVPPWCMDGAMAYCAEMAWQPGRKLRLAFDQMAPALAWANRRREHWAQPPRLPFYLTTERSQSAPLGTRPTASADR